MYETRSNLLMLQVAVQFNMFCPLMKGRILGNVYGRIIITVDGGWTRGSNVEVLQEECQPLELTCAGCECPIVSLTRRSGNGLLLLRFLANQSVAKIDAITYDRSLSVWAIGPITHSRDPSSQPQLHCAVLVRSIPSPCTHVCHSANSN